MKQIAPIWKREFFDGGDVWIEGATADPDDERARRGGGARGMRVTVRLFARLRDIAGAAELARELAPGATIGDVWRQLAGEFPELAQLRAIDLERGQRRLRADGSGGRRRRRSRVSAAGVRGMTMNRGAAERAENDSALRPVDLCG